MRSYECDIYGHVNNAVYLRYLQEANLAFFNAAGWTPDLYSSLNIEWWPARINFEYLVPLRYGNTVDVTVKVTGIGPSHLLQSYEFHNRETGELVAHSITLSTLRDVGEGKPAQMPQSLREALTNEGQILPPPEFPPDVIPKPPPPGAYRTHKQVELYEVNSKKELDPATLLVYTGECGRQVINAHGWPIERMFEEGFAILLKSNKIEYYLPVCLDDELEIVTWVSNLRRVSALRHYTIHRVKDGVNLANVHALGVWVDLAKGTPRRAPDQFLSDFAPNISSED